jgi:hypothetical protein
MLKWQAQTELRGPESAFAAPEKPWHLGASKLALLPLSFKLSSLNNSARVDFQEFVLTDDGNHPWQVVPYVTLRR